MSLNTPTARPTVFAEPKPKIKTLTDLRAALVTGVEGRTVEIWEGHPVGTPYLFMLSVGDQNYSMEDDAADRFARSHGYTDRKQMADEAMEYGLV